MQRRGYASHSRKPQAAKASTGTTAPTADRRERRASDRPARAPRGPGWRAAPGRRRAAGSSPSSSPPNGTQPQRPARSVAVRRGRHRRQAPGARPRAKTASAETATQIAAGASTRNGAARRADVLGAEPAERHQHGHRRRAADQRDHGRAGERAAETDATRPTNSSSAPGGWPPRRGSPSCRARRPGSGPRSPRSMRGTSWTCRAVRRYSLWLTISRVRPDRPVDQCERQGPGHASRRTS